MLTLLFLWGQSYSSTAVCIKGLDNMGLAVANRFNSLIGFDIGENLQGNALEIISVLNESRGQTYALRVITVPNSDEHILGVEILVLTYDLQIHLLLQQRR